MKKLALSILSVALFSQTLQAVDFDRYMAIGGGNVNFDQTGFSDGKSIHVKLGVTQEEGFGIELEYASTVDPLTTATQELDIITAGSYATYRVMINGEYSLKGRLGWLDKTYNYNNNTLNGETKTDVSYGLQLNYEPIEDQVIYLDYTISKAGSIDLIVISAGVQYFF